MLFFEKISENCRAFENKAAIEFRSDGASEIVTYRDLQLAIEQTAAWLHSLGVRRGDRVAARIPKSLAGIYIHLATCRLGAVSMPLNPAYSSTELVYFLSDAGAKLFIIDDAEPLNLGPVIREAKTLQRTVSVNTGAFDRFVAPITERAPAVEIAPDLTVLMLYTSGTTGRPKAAELSHSNLTAIIDSLHQAWDWRPDDVLLHVLPMFHAHGLLMALHGALNAGARTIAFEKFDAELTLTALRNDGCTVLMGVPTIHSRLVETAAVDGAALSHMRLITCGSARLGEDLFARFSQRFGYELVERYGMTETGILSSSPLDGERRPGWVGVPLPGVELRVVDPETGHELPADEVGEIQTRGPQVFKGYWGDAAKTAVSFTPDGWFRTGDIGLVDAEGYFQLRGRSAELIISGGFNVYPLEVERVLDSHRGVLQSAVIGCLDAEWGEVVTAVVAATSDRPDEKSLLEHCRPSFPIER